MNLPNEVDKALRGEYSRVKLSPIPPDDLAVERDLQKAGFDFAMGRNYESREEFVEKIIKENKMPEIEGSCPFCGGIDLVPCGSFIACKTCDACGPSADTPEEAIEKWNTRAEVKDETVQN